MAAETTDFEIPSEGVAGLDPQTARESAEAFEHLDPETKRRMLETEHAPEPLSPSLGQTALSAAKELPKEPAVPHEAEKEPQEPLDPNKPAPKPTQTASSDIHGLSTVFHYNYDGSRDKEDPGSSSFFGVNLDDPNLQGAAVPVDILEAQYGKFTRLLPNGTYAALDTPEARDIISQIKRSHVLVTGPDGTQKEFPIVDIQGSLAGHPHRVIDLTLGAVKALGLSDNTYLSYQIVTGDGTTLSAQDSWSDSSPIARLYRNHPEYSKLSPAQILAAAKAEIAPDMPDKDFEEAMRSPDGKERIAKERARTLSPGDEIRKLPSYAGLSDDDLAKKIYSQQVKSGQIDPAKIELSTFKETLFPHPSAWNSMLELFDGDSSFWRGAKRAGSATGHSMSAQLYDLPSNIEAIDRKIFGGIPFANQVRKFVDEHSSYPDYFRKLVGYFHGVSQAQEKQAEVDQQRAAQVGTVPGQVGKVVGGAAAKLALTSPLLLSGAPIKTIAAFSGAYEAVSKAGEAAQKNQNDWLLQGLEAGGMDYLSLWMANSPAGRLQSGFNVMLAGTGSDTASKLLTGQPIDWTQTFTRAAVEVGTGAILAQGKVSPYRTGIAEDISSRREVSPTEILGPEPPPEKPSWQKDVLVTRLDPGVWTPQSLLKATQELPRSSPAELARRAGAMAPEAGKGRHVFMPEDPRQDIVRDALRAAAEAKENGDTPTAVKEMNRALAAHNGEEQKKIGQTVIDFTAKVADNSGTPGRAPKPLTKTDEIMVRQVFGTGEIEILEGKPLDDKAALEKHLSDGAQGTKFYSGIDLGIISQAIGQGVKAVTQHPVFQQLTDRPGFAPERISRAAGRMADIAKAQTSHFTRTRTTVQAEIAHAIRLDEVLRGGEKVGRRVEFFSKMGRAKLKAVLIAHEQGKSSGDAIADKILAFHDLVYRAIEVAEKLAGIKYDAKELYIYHGLKNRQQKEAFEKYYNALVSSDPRFTHARTLPTWKEVFEQGYEPSSYNPERLMQMRLAQSMAALKKIMTFREAESVGLAFNTKRDVPQSIKDTYGDPVRAPNGERYYLQPDAQTILHRAWDDSSLYNLPIIGIPARALSMAKGSSVTFKLGWSWVHAKHMWKMGLTHAMTQLTRAAIHGHLRGELFQRELLRAFTFGHYSAAEVQYWKGLRPESTLTPEEKLNVQHAEWAHLDFSMNEERRIQFGERLHEWFPKAMENVPHGTLQAMRWGYDFLSSQVWQRAIFDTMIPQMKFDALKSMRDSLLREHPELLKPENIIQFKHELGAIGDQIEARFGEMFYDNLLWRKLYKDIGTTGLLSTGWTLSAWRVYAGGLHDFAALVGKGLEGKISRDDLTDRLLFMLWYTGLNAAEAGIINYVSNKLFGGGGDPMPKGRDFVFPRIGKNPDGSDKRVSPVEFSRELATWDMHIREAGGWLSPSGVPGGTAAMVRNKLQPVLGSLIQQWENKNFYGQQIADPNDSDLKQWGDRLKEALVNTFSPISISTVVQPTGQPQSWVDVLWASVGFPKAANWTGRSDIENRIVDTAHRLDSRVKTEENIKRGIQYEKLRTAIIQKNEAERHQAVLELKKLNVSQSTISHIERHPNENYVHHLWKTLPAEEQTKILGHMSKEERKEYQPLAHKSLRPQTPGHAALLPSGTMFFDPLGNLRRRP